MRRGIKELPPERSPKKSSTVRSPRQEMSRQEDEDIELCLDNDLGAEWPGNVDCVAKATRKSRG
jgi:hypothetical protein